MEKKKGRLGLDCLEPFEPLERAEDAKTVIPFFMSDVFSRDATL